jgi:hypothetical protein
VIIADFRGQVVLLSLPPSLVCPQSQLSLLTLQCHQVLNPDHCSEQRDFKFRVPSNVITLYNALRLAACKELKFTEGSHWRYKKMSLRVNVCGEEEVISKYVIVSCLGGSFKLQTLDL